MGQLITFVAIVMDGKSTGPCCVGVFATCFGYGDTKMTDRNKPQMHPRYSYLHLWTHPANYYGDTYYDYYVISTAHRDSNLLDNHNHDYIWRDLHDALYNKYAVWTDGKIDSEWLIKPSFSHWAVGWTETIMVRLDAPDMLLEKANNLLDDLANYPVLDDEMYSRKVWEEMRKYWDQMSMRERVELLQDNNCNIFAARHSDWPEELDEVLERIVEE